MSVEGVPLPKAFRSEFFPLDRLDPGGDLTAILSKILVTEHEAELLSPGPGGNFSVGLTVAEELVLEMVGLEGFAIVLGGASTTTLSLGAEWSPGSVMVKLGAGARLRFPRHILKPVVEAGGEWIEDPSRPFAELTVSAGIIIDQDWNVTFDGANAFTLPPAMVADSGFVIAGEVALDFSETTQLPESAAIGLPASWRGVVFRTLTAHLPPAITEAVPIASVSFNNFHIGSGGVSGTVTLNGTPGGGALAGFPFIPTSFGIELVQNSLVGVDIAGTLTLPFFDAPIGVEVGFDLQGNLTVGLSGTGGTGLLNLSKPGLLDMQLDSITFQREGGVFAVSLGGRLTPKVGGLDWPTFGVEALTIDSTGAVTIEGGWIELREQYVLAFYGFQFSISSLGFGTDTNGDRWIGFNGGLKLVEGLSAGASVEGMRISWSPTGPLTPSLSLEGVGVEFDIPGVLSFRGFVAMREPEPGVFRFDGDISLQLNTPELRIDGQLVIGYNQPEDFTFFAIYIGVELPVGIPLWTTGLGLYGMAGLFALNMEPGRLPDEAWYEIPPGASWYHRDPPGVGVAQLRKWDDAEGSFGLGAGITIGTVADNGFTFAGRLLFAIVFPGPIIFLEGRANVLKSRATLNDDPIFRALLVIDGREGTVTAGLDARYLIADGGELIDIHGSLEAFFDFDDLDAWHLYLGVDEPRERRIGADIFARIFHADAYFMIDSSRLRTGAWAGIEKSWRFGPVSVDIEAWIDGRADLSFKPVYFQGALAMHGGFGVSIFGFGFHLSVTAALAAGVFDPFHIRADLSVSVDLPWPLPDFSVDFSLEWGPEPDPPLLPAPVKEVALGHDLVTATWPLAPGQLVLPTVDAGSPQAEFFVDQPPALLNPDQAPPATALVPVVPMDARPEITFGRSVHDDALAGTNAQPQYASLSPVGWSRLGDPAANKGPVLIRPALKEVQLDTWGGGVWTPVARAGAAPDPSVPRELYGSWMPVPAEAGGGSTPAQTKLRVWARSPFSFTRRTGSAWTDQFLDLYPDYPCVRIPEDRRVCCTFTGLKPGDRPAAPWACEDGRDVFVVTWSAPPGPVIEQHGVSPDGPQTHTHVPARTLMNALCFPPGAQAVVAPAVELNTLSVRVLAQPGLGREVCLDYEGRRGGRGANPRREAGHVFTVFALGGDPAPVSEIRTAVLPDGARVTGLECGVELRCELAAPAHRVRASLSSLAARAGVTAIDVDGRPVRYEPLGGDRQGRVDVEFEALEAPIARLVVTATKAGETLLHSLCADRGPSGSVVLEAFDGAGRLVASMLAVDGRAEVSGRDAERFVIRANGGGFCLLEVCASVGLEVADRLRYETLAAHTVSELARWQADEAVLPPYSTFRMKVVTALGVQLPAGSQVTPGFAGTRSITQLAYFRTEGPPGLAVLSAAGASLVPGAGGAQPGDPPALETGLEDLSRYVVQTVPATVAPEGEPPRLTRPVYRGYDVGVVFATNYVDLMYALAGRDLTLALFDMNDRPVRDARGRIPVIPNRWGRTDQLSVSETDQRWLQVLDRADCTGSAIDLGLVARNKTTHVGGFVLDPETTYEGRLVPLLAAETFEAYPLAASASGTGALLAGTGAWSWRVHDEGGAGGPSLWQIGESGTPAGRYVKQTSNISAGTGARTDPFPGGSLLQLADTARLAAAHPDQPSAWTDYRLSGYVRSIDDDVAGLGVRMDGRRGYLLKLDRQRNLRQLVLVRPGSASVLAEAPGGYPADTDVHVAFEAVGNRLRVHLDGDLLFDVTDDTRAVGTVALYSADNAGVRFTGLRVDDLRPRAPVAYRFKFTTSAFADFRHHLLSGDERPRSAAADAAALSAAATAAVDPAGSAARVPPGEAEGRAHDALVLSALGPPARQRAGRFEAVRLETGGATAGLLLRTAEPVDWTRTSVSAGAAADQAPDPVPAGPAKIVTAGFAAGAVPDPAHESAGVLLLEDRDLSGHLIERRTLPSPAAPSMADGEPLWDGDFIVSHEIGGGLPTQLWSPALNDLSELELEPPPPGAGTPAWQATAGVLTQAAAFTTPDVTPPGSPLEHPSTGTLAIGPQLADADVRITARIRLKPIGAAGLVFRYADDQNYYRFSIDRRRGRRILSRFTGGVFQVLHVSGLPLVASTYDLVVEAAGSQLLVRVNGLLVASVNDPEHGAGAVGFYAQGAALARFEAVRVERIARSLGDWRIDDTSPDGRRGVWRIAHGAIEKEASAPPAAGRSFALIDGGAWSDLRLSTVLIQPPGASAESGLVWRYLSTQDHMRLTIAPATAQARLIARRAGSDVILWTGAVAGGPGRAVTVEAVGRRLRVWADGVLLAEVEDAGLGTGTLGAYAEMGEALAAGPFDVLHAAPAFEAWHTFGPEGTRVSGRRVRVAAGAEPAGYVQPAGEDALWQGAAASGFRRAFPPEGVDLRLTDGGGTVLHQRRFRPPSAYALLSVRMVRAADGAGVVLLPAAGGTLPSHELCAQFEFRRDNRAADPDSLVLSQEADRTAETATVFIA